MSHLNITAKCYVTKQFHNQIVEKLEEKVKAYESFLDGLDSYICERVIDPCGYVPEVEDRESLIDVVKAISDENEKKLLELRHLREKLK